MTVENPYIAQARLQMLKRYLPVSQNWLRDTGNDDGYIPERYFMKSTIEYDPVSYLDPDRNEAMRKMRMIEQLNEELPALDCGFCGAPTCRAFAEDVVKGCIHADECVVRVREKLKSIQHSEREKNDDGQ